MKSTIVAVAMACCAGLAAVAQKPADNPTGSHPYIQFGIVSPGETAPSSWTGDDLVAGTPAAARFVAG